MVKVAFVILHYETVIDTKECIESLMKYLHEDIEIIIVDNGSEKGKLKSIEKDYHDISQIHFLHSDKNLGFANGNNIGFLYAKKELRAEIIVLANNDLIFEQKDFVKRLLKVYEDERFDVAGPKIISLKDKQNQNPVAKMYNNINDVKWRKLKFKILYFLSCFNLDLKVSKNNNYMNKVCGNQDFQLHGACMFFANGYIKEFDGLCDKTFMYGEESILKYLVEKNNLSMKYYPSMEVYHKEATTTMAVWGKGRKKRQFYYKWNIHACETLEQLMNNKIEFFSNKNNAKRR